jgi:hypothetical protein
MLTEVIRAFFSPSMQIRRTLIPLFTSNINVLFYVRPTSSQTLAAQSKIP